MSAPYDCYFDMGMNDGGKTSSVYVFFPEIRLKDQNDKRMIQLMYSADKEVVGGMLIMPCETSGKSLTDLTIMMGASNYINCDTFYCTGNIEKYISPEEIIELGDEFFVLCRARTLLPPSAELTSFPEEFSVKLKISYKGDKLIARKIFIKRIHVGYRLWSKRFGLFEKYYGNISKEEFAANAKRR